MPATSTVHDRYVVSTSPQFPDDVVTRVPETPADAVARAVTTAQRAQHEWASLPAQARADALSAAADGLAARSSEVTDLVIREVGKPRAEAILEVGRAVAQLRYYAQQALASAGETFPANGPVGTHVMARRRPVGVAGLITPWNFPVAIPLWKAAPALAYGNAAVLKPAPEATACGLILEEIIGPHLIDGLLKVVPGGALTGTAMIDQCDAISFTGSTVTGRAVTVAAAQRGIPSQAEMGGVNASIVLPDADVEFAAATIATGAMGYAGQKCTATSRIIVVGDPHTFIDAFVDAVNKLKLGDPADPDTVVGPVISMRAQRTVLAAAEQAHQQGSTVRLGGAVPPHDGWYVQPTVVTGVEPGAYLAQQEVFGPICTVLPAATPDEAIRLVNSTEYGLSAGLFTSDLTAMLRYPQQLDVGLVRLNTSTTGTDLHVPFGGERNSSHGPREQGTAARELFTRLQTTTVYPHPAANVSDQRKAATAKMEPKSQQ